MYNLKERGSCIMLLIIYEFGTILLPIVLFWGIYLRKKEVSLLSKIYLGVFGLYYACVLHFTGAGTVYDIKLYGIDFSSNQLNLIPFSQEIDTVIYLLNLVLLMPCGFLLPLIVKKFDSFKRILLVNLGISLSIELSQLFNNRKTDIDDIILNVAGAIIGYIVYRLVAKLFPKISNKNMFNISEFVIYVLIMTIGRFLLFAEFYFASIFYM